MLTNCKQESADEAATTRTVAAEDMENAANTSLVACPAASDVDNQDEKSGTVSGFLHGEDGNNGNDGVVILATVGGEHENVEVPAYDIEDSGEVLRGRDVDDREAACVLVATGGVPRAADNNPAEKEQESEILRGRMDIVQDLIVSDNTVDSDDLESDEQS